MLRFRLSIGAAIRLTQRDLPGLALEAVRWCAYARSPMLDTVGRAEYLVGIGMFSNMNA